MQAREWHDLVPERADWGPGPWQSEPDKVQWYDRVARLPCLAVRAWTTGSWCGYVGLPPGHRVRRLTFRSGHKLSPGVKKLIHEKEAAKYRGLAEAAAEPAAKRLWLMLASRDVPLPPPNRPADVIGRYVEVHGGLNFCGECSDLTPADWRRMQEHAAEYRREAEGHPMGDVARWLREWEPILDDYEKCRAQAATVGVCHIPEPGDPHKIRWLGFDCAHAGDFSPVLDAITRKFGRPSPFERISATEEGEHRGLRGEVYRDLDYVKAECASLAQQLNELGGHRTWQARY